MTGMSAAGVTDHAARPAPSIATATAPSAAAAPACSTAAAADPARVKDLEARLAEVEAQASKLEAQNLQLASDLEKAQQVSREGAKMASLVQPPSFWRAHAQGQTVMYVELPIPGASAKASSDGEARTRHRTWVSDMETNGISVADALAALRWEPRL